MNQSLSIDESNRLQAELDQLDQIFIEVDGQFIKPSQCYHLETNPPHILYNLNCPDMLKQKLEMILSRFTGSS